MLIKSCLMAISVVLAVSGIATAQPKKDPASGSINTYPDCTLVGGNLITNCRFDTGDFTGWIQGGDPSFQNVVTGCGHSGNFCASMGSTSYNGTLTQSVATAASTCSLSFWLNNTGQPSHFGVEWNGQHIMELKDVPDFPAYTQFSASGLPASGTAFVTFQFYNVPSFINFTDVVVTCP